MCSLQVPVLLLAFNRPVETSRVMDVIRSVKPSSLYVCCDGPRKEVAGDAIAVKDVRELLKSVDWDCNIEKLFREENIGCRSSVRGALDWFFSRETDGIILEDDCVPSMEFFRYAQELLVRYREKKEIFHISGASLMTNRNIRDSYYLSAYPGVWGWATWKDRWQLYEKDIVPEEIGSMLKEFKKNYGVDTRFWSKAFLAVAEGRIDTWDYQWIYTMWKNKGYAITPRKNMVSNIGFGESATHTKDASSGLARRQIEISGEIVHPLFLERSRKDDERLSKEYFTSSSGIMKLLRYCQRKLSWL